jgi:hypothetical protein
MTSWLSLYWCSWFHGGGRIKRDCYDRINWQCDKCGRWSMPVDRQTERLITESAIQAKLKEKNAA